MPKKTTLTEFIEKARKVHGDKYDYSKVQYINSHTKVCVICPKHGEFWQTPYTHSHGTGCPKCAIAIRKEKILSNTEEFVKKAKKIHGDKYLYDKVNYVNSQTLVDITCPIHGVFKQRPNGHLHGYGCPKCAGNQKKDKELFITKSREVHGDKYIYDKVNYVNTDTKVIITCPIHGDFLQTPYWHIKGQGCHKCAWQRQSERQFSTTEEFIEKSKNIHGDKYLYDKVEYVNYNTEVCIICPQHGEFWQTPGSHIQGHGCHKCACIISKPENEINDYIKNTLGLQTIIRNKTVLDGLEMDILVPSHKLAIEYDGLHWHSEAQGKDSSYHLNKTKLAESKGYHLIHIFEDEWLERKDIILNKIKHFLGKDLDKPVIGARKCLLKTVSKAEAQTFLDTYHIQGFVGSTIYYGAFYEGNLVGVMAFKQEKPSEWNLTRFATDTAYRLPGLASKIFKQFIKDCNPAEVKTFLDRRWSHGGINVYDRMGFKLTEVLSPDYKYIVDKQRLHKFGFRKQILHKKYGLPLTMTEREMTDQLGFYRIWDCGLYKYTWKP